MKFVMTQSICPEGIEKLKADTNGQVEIIAEDNPDPNNYLDDMKDADALIVRIAKCDAHAIENSPNLKVIGAHCRGCIVRHIFRMIIIIRKSFILHRGIPASKYLIPISAR